MTELLSALVLTLQAWVGPLELSDAPAGSEPSVPAMAWGPTGQLHVAYQQKPQWRVYYRCRSSAGHWGPIEVLGSTFCPGRPEVVEDAAGRAHAVYPQRGAGDTYDLMHARREGGGWVAATIAATASLWEDYPRLARDSLGRIHLAYARMGTESGAGDIVHRVWTGSAWSGETVLGQTSAPYYQRPDIAIDPADGIHVVWIANGGVRNIVNYRRFDGSMWQPVVVIGQSTPQAGSGSFLSFPRVAAPAADKLVAVWHDDNDSATPSIIVGASSGNGGLNWTPQQTVLSGHYPVLHGQGGLAHLVCNHQPSGTALLHAIWNGAGWQPSETITPSSSQWKGWADVTADASGFVHVVYDDVADGSDQHQISYLTNEPDGTPPAEVTDLAAEAGHWTVQLSWVNPMDPDFVGTMIRYSAAGYPAGPADGTLLADRPGAPGGADSVYHQGAVNGTRYFYSAFAYDEVPNYSLGTHVDAMPYVPPDLDRDADVDQEDFGLLQACFSGGFVAQDDPACARAKLDEDEDVDDGDLAVFVGCLSGAGVAADPGCAGGR